MSRVYENGYRIEYPNELAYAGMPMIVRIDNANDYAGASITMQVGNEYYTETRTLYEGAVVFDIARYAQMAFVDKVLSEDLSEGSASIKYPQTQQYIGLSVSLTNSDGVIAATISTGLDALYGYLGVKQTNGGGVRRRKWFARYPQTFDFYATRSSRVILAVEGGAGEVVEYKPSLSNNIQQVAIEVSPQRIEPRLSDRTATLTGYYGFIYLEGDDQVYTDTTSYILDIDHSTSGVYLRWLNHLGQWCYYLFRPTGRNYTTKEVQTWQDGILRNNLVPENGVLLHSGQTMHQYSQQESISLGAKLVDAETFDLLLTLTNSPIVEVLANASDYVEDSATTPLWERVSVVGGSYARTSAPLQDFSVSIIRNAQTSQML